MPGGSGRETTRPPWMKDKKESTGKDTPAWTLRKRTSNAQETEVPPPEKVEDQLANVKASLKKQTTRNRSENGVKENKDEEEPPNKFKVKLKETPIKEKVKEVVDPDKNPPDIFKDRVTTKKPPPIAKPPPSKEEPASKKPPPAKEESVPVSSKKPPLQRQQSKEEGRKWRDPLVEKAFEKIDNTLNEIPKGHTLTKNESLRSLLKPVPPPPPPPMPPKMPPPPEFKKPPPSAAKMKKVESLKSRPRGRPDWSDMMKEVEKGIKLKRIVCNDRSSPIITKSSMVKAKGQYVYESEKGNMHNQLLKQISSGVKLKKVKCNDRSKPVLEGLRKFRRQMTIEEQLQKSMSQVNMAAQANMSQTNIPEGIKEAEAAACAAAAAPEDDEIDEMDDIDKVRDDLQSTKQLLALELRNKEAMQRENKRLLARIANMEAEMKSERAHIKQEQAKTVISVVDAYDENLVTRLKKEVTDTKRVADDLEKRYHRTAEELDETRSELEEMQRKNAEMEKKLEQALKGIVPNSNQGSRRPSHAQRQQSIQESSPEEEEDSSSGEEGENEEEKQKRRDMRELKLMSNKIKNLKEKKDKAQNERAALKVQLKNQQLALKEERKKYKALKKEVDKMAKMMKDSEDDEEEEEDEDVEEEEDEEKKNGEEGSEEETETETEQETESDTESESEEEDAPFDKKKENLTGRVKKHETSLNAMKKGNYLIIANIDRLKDDVMRQKEESASLQEDLDSVLAELE